tara:strand:+ start:990 stop:1664 length:675 start_codon:yes stop_codon:yes gene_type:complete
MYYISLLFNLFHLFVSVFTPQYKDISRLVFYSKLSILSIIDFSNNNFDFVYILNNLQFSNNYICKYLMQYSNIFFIFDLINYNFIKNFDFVIHHCIMILTLSISIYYEVYNNTMSVLAIQEVSSIFLILKNINSLKKYKKYIELMFFSSFIFLRCIPLPIIGYYIYYNNDKNYTKYIAFASINLDILLHTFWLRLLLKKIKKIFMNKRVIYIYEKDEKKITKNI